MSTDILVVNVDSTPGWTAAANELVTGLRRAGADAALAGTGTVRLVRTFALTDLVQARTARATAVRGIEEHSPRAVIYCSMTAALLWPRPGAVWLDSVAAENRPGRHGVWQRVLERRRLRPAQRADDPGQPHRQCVAAGIDDSGFAQRRQQVGPAPDRRLARTQRALDHRRDHRVLHFGAGVGGSRRLSRRDLSAVAQTERSFLGESPGDDLLRA